jgi:hypothetical protein
MEVSLVDFTEDGFGEFLGEMLKAMPAPHLEDDQGGIGERCGGKRGGAEQTAIIRGFEGGEGVS